MAMKQNNPTSNPTPAALCAGWSARKLKAQLRSRGLSPAVIAAQAGITQQAVRLTIRGERKGLQVRQAIAQALGVDVQVIWPDALLTPRERRLLMAS